MFSAMNIIGSGMSATKAWMDATSNNIANMNTTRTAEGGPYMRQSVVFGAKNTFDDLFERHIGGGVQVEEVLQDGSEKLVYDPPHPDADGEGYVRYPEIQLAAEITNMVMAQRSYGANVTALNATKEVMQKTQEIGRI